MSFQLMKDFIGMTYFQKVGEICTSYEYICKNPPQNTRKLNSIRHEMNYIL